MFCFCVFFPPVIIMRWNWGICGGNVCIRISVVLSWYLCLTVRDCFIQLFVYRPDHIIYIVFWATIAEVRKPGDCFWFMSTLMGRALRLLCALTSKTCYRLKNTKVTWDHRILSAKVWIYLNKLCIFTFAKQLYSRVTATLIVYWNWFVIV